MKEPFQYEEFRGTEIAAILEDLGGLRIAVFREYPYLYDGDLDYEKLYLETYVRSPRSLVVLLRSGERVVGATTCLPIADESPEFQTPLHEAGYNFDEVFYLGESIVLPEYRGRGAGHEFFNRREAQAREVGPFRFTAFCSVDRPPDHPSRPPGYEPLDSFWTRMGYRKRPELKCELEWKEIGEESASLKPLTFWMKEWP